VTDANKDIPKDPALVNSSAESKGWLFKIKLSNIKDLGK